MTRIWQVALQNDGKLLVVGEFTTFNQTDRNHIARLNSDGSLDPSFDPGAGPDGPVYSVAVQADGRVVIGGRFSSCSGASRSCIARLNPDGSLDTSFNPRSGAGGEQSVVYTVALQTVGATTRILAGGNFSAMWGVARNNFARLNSDGSLDYSFDPGDGPDGEVYSIVLQPDGKIMLAGMFRNVNQTRRVGIARLLDYGPVDTAFMDSAYNQYAGLVNVYFNPIDPFIDPRGSILATARQPDGNIIVAGQFEAIGGGYTRDDVRYRRNIARIIGNQTPGPGNLEFASDKYNANDVTDPLQPIEPRFIEMMRTNGHLGPASVTVSPRTLPQGPGAAVQDVDFSLLSTYSHPTWITTWPADTWQLKDGTFGQNQGYTETVRPNWVWNYSQNDVWLNVLLSTNLGDRYLNLQLSNPKATDLFFLGGENIPLGVALGRSSARSANCRFSS